MSFFTSTPKPNYKDKVWKSKEARCRGVATEALRMMRLDETALVLFFFQKNMEEFVFFLETNGAPFHVLDSESQTDPNPQQKSIFILDAFAKSPGALDFLFERSGISRLNFIFFGHYPLVSVERDVLDGLAKRLGTVSTQFCLSLEDALFVSFGSDRLISLMNTLGMVDQEFIEHAMISKAILTAREKLDSKIEMDTRQRSEEEWFDINVNLIK